jgi:hypothetical protein
MTYSALTGLWQERQTYTDGHIVPSPLPLYGSTHLATATKWATKRQEHHYLRLCLKLEQSGSAVSFIRMCVARCQTKPNRLPCLMYMEQLLQNLQNDRMLRSVPLITTGYLGSMGKGGDIAEVVTKCQMAQSSAVYTLLKLCTRYEKTWSSYPEGTSNCIFNKSSIV